MVLSHFFNEEWSLPFCCWTIWTTSGPHCTSSLAENHQDTGIFLKCLEGNNWPLQKPSKRTQQDSSCFFARLCPSTCQTSFCFPIANDSCASFLIMLIMAAMTKVGFQIMHSHARKAIGRPIILDTCAFIWLVNCHPLSSIQAFEVALKCITKPLLFRSKNAEFLRIILSCIWKI